MRVSVERQAVVEKRKSVADNLVVQQDDDHIRNGIAHHYGYIGLDQIRIIAKKVKRNRTFNKSQNLIKEFEFLLTKVVTLTMHDPRSVRTSR